MPLPRIQRCFLKWMEDADLAFRLRKVRRTDRFLEFRFEGITPALRVILSRYDIDVWVEWEGEDWDAVYSEYVSARRAEGGWTCTACPADTRKLWASREALWREHLFGLFLDWVNGTLAEAELLALDGKRDSMTWAKLLTPEQRDRAAGALAVLPVRMP